MHAAQRGRVVLAAELFFSGQTIVLDHGLGLYTFYGHLQSIAVGVGDVVEAGTPLGRVGATGRVTRAHLHWAVRLNEAQVNPLQLVKFAPYIFRNANQCGVYFLPIPQAVALTSVFSVSVSTLHSGI